MVRCALVVPLLVLALGAPARADGEKKLRKVDLLLDVTWAGKRGIQVPISPGGGTLRGACPPIVEINTRFEPADPVPVEVHYSFSDGRALERQGTLFPGGGLATEEWEIPIKEDGQEFKGSVSLHVGAPGIEQNDVSAPFAVACASKVEAAAAACDTSGNACHAGLQLAAPVRTELSKDPPPTAWTGGKLVPGTYLLTAAKQYTFEGTTVSDDGKPSQATVVIRKAGAGELAELVTTEGACTQRATIGVAHDPKPQEGMAGEWAKVFSGPRALALSSTCPPSPGGGPGFPAAYAVTADGFRLMLFTGTVVTFTRKK